ncbi:unnamed protein product [Musa hybrid cultivar]
MRGFAAASAPPARRRWKGPAVAVLALVVVVFSLLVPLAFLLGIHSHFRSGESPTLLGVVSLVPSLKNPKCLYPLRWFLQVNWLAISCPRKLRIITLPILVALVSNPHQREIVLHPTFDQ